MEPMPIIRYECMTCKVRDCSILKGSDTLTLQKISEHKHTRRLEQGARLFCEGDPVQGVLFIKRGFLKIELNGKQGRPLILRISGKGAVFGHRASFSQSVHTCSATAVTPVDYCFIPNHAFQKIAEGADNLRQQIVNQFLLELELAEKKALTLAHKTVREKVADALLLMAEAYQYGQAKRSFRIDFCRQDIADLAGTTKEQVSKSLKDFETQGLIKCTGKKFSFIDIGLLQKISG